MAWLSGKMEKEHIPPEIILQLFPVLLCPGQKRPVISVLGYHLDKQPRGPALSWLPACLASRSPAQRCTQPRLRPQKRVATTCLVHAVLHTALRLWGACGSLSSVPCLADSHPEVEGSSLSTNEHCQGRRTLGYGDLPYTIWSLGNMGWTQIGEHSAND